VNQTGGVGPALKTFIQNIRKMKKEQTKNMKRKLQIIISTSAASVMALSALGQASPTPNKDGPDYAGSRMSHTQRPDSLNDAAKASDIIGMTGQKLSG
jgi:hypothetical protein